MSKILVISDSHGKKEYIDKLTAGDEYDYVFHLGDGADRDLGTNEYDPKFLFVKGNCDYFSDKPITQSLNLDGYKILLTHGDTYKVKFGLETIKSFATSKGYDIVCFGHTHRAMHEVYDGVHYINPGALKNGEYAELVLQKDVKVEFKNIKD